MSNENSCCEGGRRVIPLVRPRWKATQPRSLELFFRNLHRLLPVGSCLFLEGVAVDPELRTYLASQQPAVCPAVELETIRRHGEGPPGYHVPVREDVLSVVADFSKKWYEIGAATPGLENNAYAAQAQVCDHIKAYIDDREILAWYDVGLTTGACWYVADCIHKCKLLDFCRVVDSTLEPV